MTIIVMSAVTVYRCLDGLVPVYLTKLSAGVRRFIDNSYYLRSLSTLYRSVDCSDAEAFDL